MTNFLGGLNTPDDAMTIGLVQFAVPRIARKEDVETTLEKICAMVRNARATLPQIDLLVFPEYSLIGLNPQAWLDSDLLLDLEGPEVKALAAACREAGTWGCFSIMEKNPSGAPYNTGIICDDEGRTVQVYRKMHPWVPAEPWAPGDRGVKVCDGPKGSKLSLIICHDGMLPEMAREASYLGANVILRTAGYTYPIQDSWRATNIVNAFTNLAFTASVCLAGPDELGIWSQGEAMVCSYDGTVISQGDGSPDRIVTCGVRPREADEARRTWGVENNIYQLGHRGYVAVEGGATDCPYTYMNDLMKGQYRLPWEDEIRHVDGTRTGYPAPAQVRARPGGIG